MRGRILAELCTANNLSATFGWHDGHFGPVRGQMGLPPGDFAVERGRRGGVRATWLTHQRASLQAALPKARRSCLEGPQVEIFAPSQKRRLMGRMS